MLNSKTTEFEYRFGIYDKFIRDIIDYLHLGVLNKLNFVSTHVF